MQHDAHERFIFRGLLCLLAFAPLVRGGHQVWAALTVTAGVLGLLALVWLRALWTHTSPLSPWSRQDLLLFVAALWVWIGLRRAAAPPDALDAFLIFLGCVACFFLARALASHGSGLRLALGLCAIGSFIALLGLFQLFGVIPHGWWNPPQFVAATFVNHNQFASYLALLLPISVALWCAAPLSPPQRFFVCVSGALMAIGLILSCSRGAWLALAMVTALGLGWWARRRRPREVLSWRGVAGLTVAALAIGFLVSQPAIVARGMSLADAPNDASVQTRVAIWQGAWELMKEHPLIGHGLGSLPVEFPRHRPTGVYGQILYAFNEYLQAGAELGLVGVLLALGVALLVGSRVVRLIRLSHTPWKRALGLGGLIGLGSVGLHSVADYPWHIPAVAFTFAAVAGLLAGTGYHADPVPLRMLRIPSAGSRPWLARSVVTLFVVATLVAAFRPLGQGIVADVWAQRASREQQAGTLEEAIARYRQAASLAPWRAEYYQGLGESLVQSAWKQRGRERQATFRQAAAAYEKALALIPHDGASAQALGEVLQATGEIDAADRWLQYATTRDPNNPLSWKRLAELKLLRGEAVQASEAFRRAAGLAKPHRFLPFLFDALDDPTHFVEVGESALLLGRVKVAQTAFAVATQFQPNHPAAQVGLALCAMHRGDAAAAQQLLASTHEPLARARWFAGLARYYFRQGEVAKARAALDTGLKLDPSNILARHLQLVLARAQQDDAQYVEAVDHVLSLNRPPVFVRSGADHEAVVVWEPERGTYERGRKTHGGWALINNGLIHQSVVIPPGNVRFRVTASGTRARGVGPTMAVFWNGRLLKTTEVTSESWATYDIDTEVYPGESLLTVSFINDLEDLSAREDRNLKLEKIAATWERR